MTIITNRDGPAVEARFEIESIGNGYLVRHNHRPDRTDPFGQRHSTLFVPTLDDVAEACGAHIAAVKDALDAERERR